MKLLTCGMAMSLALCTSAYAAEPAPPPAPAVQGAPSAHSIDLARRYMVAIHADAGMDRMIAILLPTMMKMASEGAPNLADQQKADMTVEMTSAAQVALAAWKPKYVERLQGVIARVYTDDELQAALTFYESPAGRSMIAKQGALTDASVQLGQEMSPDLKKLMLEQICKKLDRANSPQLRALEQS